MTDKQHTISKSVTIKGVGLHSGGKVTMRMKPAPENHGIKFRRVDLEGKDEFYFSDRHEVKSPAYDLLNARLGWANDSWSVALWGRNLTDEDYFPRGFGSFGNDPATARPGTRQNYMPTFASYTRGVRAARGVDG